MTKAKLDFDRMRKDVAKAQHGGDRHTLKEGQTLFYVCPPVHDSEPLPYAEGQMGFSFGQSKSKTAVVNLEGLEECEPLLEALKRLNITYEQAQKGWKRAEELIEKYGNPKRQGFRNRWWWNVVCMGHRTSPRKDWDIPEEKVEILAVGKTLFDGFTDQFFDVGDITDYDEAILIIVTRTGQGLKTEYKVKLDVQTTRDPLELEDDFIDFVSEALVPGKGNDLHDHLARQVKTVKEIEDLWYGEDEEDEEDDDEPRRRKAKVTTRSASSRRRSRRSDDDEEGEEEEKPKKSRRSRRSKADDEETEEEEKPKQSRRSRRSKKKDDDEIEEESDESEVEESSDVPDVPEEKEEEPVKKERPVRKPRRSAKKEEEKEEEKPADDPDEISDAEALKAAVKRRAGRKAKKERA